MKNKTIKALAITVPIKGFRESIGKCSKTQ